MDLGIEIEDKCNPTYSFLNLLSVHRDGDSLTMSPKDNYMYCDGIKQMLSHYIGVSNFMNDRTLHLDGKEVKIQGEISLAEIVFKFEKVSKPYFKNYEVLYGELAEHLNKKEGFAMIPNLLTYQGVLSDEKNKCFKISDRIRHF